jgi:hypothetical protein
MEEKENLAELANRLLLVKLLLSDQVFFAPSVKLNF